MPEHSRVASAYLEHSSATSRTAQLRPREQLASSLPSFPNPVLTLRVSTPLSSELSLDAGGSKLHVKPNGHPLYARIQWQRFPTTSTFEELGNHCCNGEFQEILFSSCESRSVKCFVFDIRTLDIFLLCVDFVTLRPPESPSCWDGAAFLRVVKNCELRWLSAQLAGGTPR